jgi:hypothetical protein
MLDEALIALDRMHRQNISQHAAGPLAHGQNQPTSAGAHLHEPEIPLSEA